MKHSLSIRMRSRGFQVWILSLLLPIFGLAPSLSLANPSGANVVHGGVSFNGLGTSNLTINQSTGAAIINWQNFSIDSNEITQFVQPGVDSVAINRVVSGNPTDIYGQLSANGSVIVINPNGIVVGETGVIDVAGSLTLSTLDASNSSLLSGQQIGGSTRYRGLTRKAIRNLGSIAAGDVTLLTNYLQNQGTILGAGGVNIGAGGDILVQRTTDGANITIQGGVPGGGVGVENSGVISGADTSIKAHGNSYSMAINNSGTVRARGWAVKGGRLKLSAGSGGSIVNTGVVSAARGASLGGEIQIEAGSVDLQSGRVDASGLIGGGSIDVMADSISVGADSVVIADGTMAGGSISLTGSDSVDVSGHLSATGLIGDGGSVDLTADQVNASSTARIDASGALGGAIRIGGGYKGEDAGIANADFTSVADGALILADGSLGDGGQVVIWADQDTMFSGDVSAQAVGATGNGGFVEVSGKRNLTFDGFVSTLANNGQNGTLLLDPTDVVINSTGGTGVIQLQALVGTAHGINGWSATHSGGLLHNNNVIISTSGSGSGAGNITIGDSGGNADDIHYSSDNSFTLLAHGSIFVNSNVLNHQDNSGASTGNINLIAGWDGNGLTSGGLPGSGDFVDIDVAKAFSWGNNDGIVRINAAGFQEVSIGSRSGETNVLADSVLVTSTGTREFAQIGYRNYLLDDATGYHSSGDINVFANSTIAVSTNLVTNGLQDAHAMIGHGGSIHRNVALLNDNGSVENPLSRVNDTNFNTVSENQLNNDTIYKASGKGSMGGDISVISTGGAVLVTGSDDRSFAQIGHGGLGEDFDAAGVNADASNTPSSTFSTEFFNPDGTASVGIVFTPSGATLTEAIGEAPPGNRDQNNIDVSSSANLGRLTLVRINDEIMGIKNVDNGTRVDFERGLFGTSAPTGGHAVGTDIELIDIPDGVAVADAVVGYLEGTKQGNISVEGLIVEIKAGQRTNGDSTGDAHAAIGHGGRSAPGAASGNISVISQTSIVGHGSDADSANSWNTRAQIGHGGINSGAFRNNETADFRDAQFVVNSTAPGHSGAILVEARNGTIEFLAGHHTNNYAQIGHGGTNAHGNHSTNLLAGKNDTSGVLKSGITVTATGDIVFDRLDDSLGRANRAGNAYVQIGNGGYNAVGGFSGDIDVDSGGKFEMHGANAGGAYAQLGHGGRSDSWGDVNNLSNGKGYADLTGNIDLDVNGDVLMRSGSYGEDSYAQIGHGGLLRKSNLGSGHSGDIDIDANGNIYLEAGGVRRDTTVTGYDMVSNRNYSMIGHGGRDGFGNHHGDISIDGSGDLKLESYYGFREYNDGGNRYNGTARGQESFAQIGHGGDRSDGDNGGVWGLGIGVLGSADISVNMAGDVNLASAVDAGQIARNDITNQTEDDLDVLGTGTTPPVTPVTMTPIAMARLNYTQIGHGGRGGSRNVVGRTIEGDVIVNSGGNVNLSGGTVDMVVDNLLAEFLNGSQNGGTPINGRTLAQNDNDTISNDNYARIGNGGNFYRVSTDGDVVVAASGDVTLQGGSGRRDMAVIGNGGYDSGFGDSNFTATRDGSISVFSGGSVSVTGSNAAASVYRAAEFSHAQIGNDISLDSMTDNSSISVSALEDITVRAGSYNMDAYAQIGSGGVNRGRVRTSGAIDVTAGRDVFVIGDNSVAAPSANVNGTTYAKIGHGSRVVNTGSVGDRAQNQNGSQWNGDIHVRAGNDVNLADGFIGHIDSNGTEGSVVSSVGDTFVAASRINPDYVGSGVGAIVADANSGFSSADQGFAGELRLYMPNRPNNSLQSGVTLNGGAYTPIGGVADDESYSGEGFSFSRRGDENLDIFDNTLELASYSASSGQVDLTNNGISSSSAVLTNFSFNFANDDFQPEGDYSLVNGLGGFYQLYYNNLTAPTVVDPGSGLGPTGGAAPTPVVPTAFDYTAFVGEAMWETYDFPYGLLVFDVTTRFGVIWE